MPASGDIIYASDINTAGLKVVRRGNRTASKSSTAITSGTEAGMLRVDNVPLVGGRVYLIELTGLRGDSSVDTDLLAGHIRYAAGSTATTSSTELAKSEQTDQRTMYVAGLLPVASSATYSILATVRRAIGGSTANITWYGEPSLNLIIWDGGTDPGDTGVDI